MISTSNALSMCYMCSAVRQGRLLSPVSFEMYVNDTMINLETSKVGCYIGEEYFGCLMYASDLVLLPVSICALQLMIEICEGEAKALKFKYVF